MVDRRENGSEHDVACEETTQKNDALVACQAELAALTEKFKYVSADFDNYRRRVEKEKIQWMQVAQAGLIKDVLPVLDDFERAVQQQNTQEISAHMREWLSGFEMIGSSLEKVLKAAGLQEITELEAFDPEIHEAVAHIESADHVSGSIVSVLQKGYRFKDQVIRPALVSVAK